MGLDIFITGVTKKETTRNPIGLETSITGSYIETSYTETMSICYFQKMKFLYAFVAEHTEEDIELEKDIYLDIDHLNTLLGKCEYVLNNRDVAEHVLSTDTGIYFGSAPYDDGYFFDVAEVKDALMNKIIPACLTLGYDIYISFSCG